MRSVPGASSRRAWSWNQPSHRRAGRVPALLCGVLAALVLLALSAASALAAPPTVTIENASEVGFTSAHVAGSVDPADHETGYRFEYTTQAQWEAEGSSFANAPQAGNGFLPEGAGSSPVQATLENLAPNTTYHLRLYAENSGVEPIETAEATAATFTTQATTPPTLSLTVTEVSYLKAHLAATIDPVGGNVNPIGGALPIAWELELSHEPLSEGWNIVPAAGQIKEAEAESNSPIDISADTPPLAPGTEYHARLVATGPGYEAISPEEAFTTLAVAKPTIENLAVSAITAHTATFSAAVNPNAPEAEGSTSPAESEAFKTHYRFECNPECPGLEGEVPAGNAPEAVSKEATGLIPGHLYEVTLTATNAGGTETAGPLPFTTEALEPQIDATFLVAASETTANLGARVNPGGAATTVHFEYLSEAQFKADGNSFGAGTIATPESAAIGSDVEDHVAEAPIKGLAPNTAYRYRAVATNAKSPAGLPGPAETFQTRPAVAAVPCPNEALRQGPSAALPECRAFELVTPPYKDGYAVNPVAISDDGSRVLGESLGVFAGAPGAPETRNDVGLYYQLARGPGGWQTTPLTPANPQFRGATTFFTAGSDLIRTLFSMPTAPVGEDDFYLRGPGASLAHVGPITPPADGPSREPAPEGSIPVSSFQIEGASSDLSHIVFGVRGKYGWNGDPTFSQATDLYEYVGTGNSEPAMVAVTGGPGSTALIGQCGATVGGPLNTSRFNAVSAAGDTVFFTPLAQDDEACGGAEPAVAELYARLNQSQTVAISAPECETGCAAESLTDSVFAGASHDGSRVWFLSTQKLTEGASEDATAGDTAYEEANGGSGCQQARGTGCNLYEYDFAKPSGARLTAVSAGSLAPHVQGVVRISADGTHVYFVAQGKLTSQPNARDEQAQAGMNNLYVFERGSTAEGTLRFIATLAPSEGGEGAMFSADEELWGGVRDADSRPAQATPDGTHLVFESHADLTPDDTSKGVWQVFSYDAATDGLTRISVGDGGFNHNGNTTEYNATILRPPLRGRPGVPLPTPLALSNDGSYVFFESADPLAPAMSLPAAGANPREANVYVYHAGEVHLIHVFGATRSPETFLGTSETGADAFFKTVDRLVPQDTDTQVDIYDARIDGGNPAPAALPPCQGSDACHGPAAAAPSLSAPASTSFTGPANPSECPKGKVKKSGHCVKRKAKHTKKHKAKKRHARSNGKAGK